MTRRKETKDLNQGRNGHGVVSDTRSSVMLQGAMAMNKPFTPLSKDVPIPNGILNPYRVLIVIRLVFMVLCLLWRLQNPNEDAYWLWFISVICEFWLAFSWSLDIIPKFFPKNRSTNLEALKQKFDPSSPSDPIRQSDLPGIDLFVTTTDPEKESVFVTANAILSILAADYPVEKITCYVSDDGGALLTFEAMVEAAKFAEVWVPFCKKHDIELRDPEVYFSLRGDLNKREMKCDFDKDCRRIKRRYDEFKVWINGLPDSIRRRSNTCNGKEETKMVKQTKVRGVDQFEPTLMADGTQWPGTWVVPSSEHTRGDHAGILKVILKPPPPDPVMGTSGEKLINFSDTDIRLPMFVYVSREKRPGYDHNKKAGAMNALARASAVLSNGPFILNLDCDHYFHNSKAIREGMCFMLDRGAQDICYVQFPQRFYGVDPSDRYANHSYVFYGSSMRAYDGLQGPFYVGTGTLFRRFALYGFEPPNPNTSHKDIETQALFPRNFDSILDGNLMRKRFGNSTLLAESIPIAEYQGRPLADHTTVMYGRPPGALRIPHEPLDSRRIAEALSVISCCFEEKTEWGDKFGWIYGSATEDIVTGYSMHNRGWRSVFCTPKRDAFRGLAPINLTDRLHQILRWATGSLDIFFSKNSGFFASRRLTFMQQLVYINIGVYPFTSFFIIMYCFIPAYSLITGKFNVETPSIVFLAYLLIYTVSSVFLSILEMEWSGVELEDWWRNEQFWVICCMSSYIAACVQVLLRLLAGIKISFPVTTKPASEDEDDPYAELYDVKWTSLMALPIVIGLVNIIALCYSLATTMNSSVPSWGRFIGAAALSFWVLAHLYPFAKGLTKRRRKISTLVYIWFSLAATIAYLLYVRVKYQSNPLQLQVTPTFTLP